MKRFTDRSVGAYFFGPSCTLKKFQAERLQTICSALFSPFFVRRPPKNSQILTAPRLQQKNVTWPKHNTIYVQVMSSLFKLSTSVQCQSNHFHLCFFFFVFIVSLSFHSSARICTSSQQIKQQIPDKLLQRMLTQYQ